MKEIPREKTALIVFVACLLLIVAGIVAYLFAGHSWNYAASRIDDAAGEMEGYNVVLYEGTSIPSSPRVDARGSLTMRPLSLEAARLDYVSKGAQVHCLDLLHPERYGDPIVISGDGYRIGVVAFVGGDTIVEMQGKVDYLDAHDVGTVIAIVPTEATLSKVEGVDVYIDLGERSALSAGESSSNGYRIAMPETGTIGAIVISPSEVVSARTISG